MQGEPPPVLEGYRRLKMRSVPFVAIAACAIFSMSACTAPQPTSFGSTLSYDSGDVGLARQPDRSSLAWSAIGVALGLESRDRLDCPRGPVPQYAVRTFLAQPKIDDSLSLDQIARLMKVDFRHMALGATESREVVFGLITVKTMASAKGGVCAYPTRIVVTLGLTARKIHIASEFAEREPCVYNEVLGHEERHVALDDQLMRAAAESLRGTAAKRFRDTYGVWGRNPASARRNLQRRLERDEDTLRADIKAIRLAAHAKKIDTPQERRRLVNACGRRLARLYPGYS